MTSNRISAILLAAGFSSRMGKLKALLPWEGIPLINYQIEQLQQAGIDEIIVVLGYQSDQIKRVISKFAVKTIVNEQYEQGKSSSICKGAESISHDTEGIVVTAVDQPVPCQTLKYLILHLTSYQPAAVIPVYQGKSGHPILFHKDIRKDLLTVKEETKGMRDIIQNHHNIVAYLPVNDSAILLNFNNPSDYKGGMT
ncbi:nucleotidyltransferase family protein [Virgibacillus flavescens]|uniref:nucleotidyltransferase family protein n=1 Tax=Virgibacillus flavescens TaxID=1611422 RepID=UPI003D336FFE